VEARDIMYEMSRRMAEPSFLSMVETECHSILPTDMNQKHTRIQELLISQVYLAPDGGAREILSRFDKTNGHNAYVILQSLMAEHQSDPLISQYVGQAMMNVLEKAGLNMQQIQKDATAQ
jgi:hypothetical protein